MSDNIPPCCPPGSTGYLTTDLNYVAKGSIVTSSNYDYYLIESQTDVKTNGILFIPDIFGWEGGRTRSLADTFADKGYTTIVPRLFEPKFEGYDGDGIPPNCERDAMAAYMKKINWQDVIKPRVVEAITILKSKGVEKFGSIGFCWGGYPVVWLLSDDATKEIQFGINPHPSIAFVNDYVFDNAANLSQFISSIRGPLLLLPAGNDPDTYRPGGVVYEAMKGVHSDSESIDEFKDMVHGWLARGDIADENVKAKVILGLDHIFSFVSAQFSK